MLSQCPRFHSAPSEVRNCFSPADKLEAEAFSEVGTRLLKRVDQTARDSLGSCGSVAGGKAGPEGREQSSQVLLGLSLAPSLSGCSVEASLPLAPDTDCKESLWSCYPTHSLGLV